MKNEEWYVIINMKGVTMFEKEAEERAKDYTENKERQIAYECGFLDGAEFGYNKANEWHYVKDGDYPKDNKTVLALCIVGGEPYPYLAQYWKGSTTEKKNGVDLNWNCWLNNMQREVVEPYAWKEIVLPELKESE